MEGSFIIIGVGVGVLELVHVAYSWEMLLVDESADL